jgi:hypothetical protein
LSAIKKIVYEIQEFYDRLLAAQHKPMTAAEKASFEAELAVLKAKFPVASPIHDYNQFEGWN